MKRIIAIFTMLVLMLAMPVWGAVSMTLTTGDLIINNSAIVLNESGQAAFSKGVSIGAGLNVTGASKFSGALTISSGGADITGASNIVVTGKPFEYGLVINRTGNSGAGRGGGILFAVPRVGSSKIGGNITVAEEVNAVTTYMAFSTALNEITKERMRITSGGKIGLNQTDPSATLDVVGTSEFNGQMDLVNNPIVNIGAAGTDFSATGGLILADALTVTQSSTTGNTLYSYRDLASGLTNSPVAYIKQDNSEDDQYALAIEQDGSGGGVSITQSGLPAGTGNNVLKVASDADLDSRDLVSFQATGNSSQSVLKLIQDNAASSGNALIVDNDGEGEAIYIDSESESNAVISWNQNGGNSVGKLGYISSPVATNWFLRNVASDISASPVVLIEQDNAGDDQNAIEVQQDGTGLNIGLSGTGATCGAGDYGFFRNATSIYVCENGVATDLAP